MRVLKVVGALAALALAGCDSALNVAPAPETPQATTWAYSAKTGVGASYEAYVNGAYQDGGATGTVSRVWFSIADGVLTETMYGLIHEAQIKQLRFAVLTETGLALEGRDTTAHTEYLRVDESNRPLSPAYRIVTTDRDGRFEIEKHFFTDPDRQSLYMRVTVRALRGEVTPYLLLEPHMANTGGGDSGAASRTSLSADEAGVFMTLRGSREFERASVGFLGASDGLSDLEDRTLDNTYSNTGDARGAIMLTGELAPVSDEATYDFVISFGTDSGAASIAAAGTLSTGYEEVLARYNGEGWRIGWEDYLASLTQLPRLVEASTDDGRLLYASALMLKVQEDRTYAGALIASLSNPWGDTVSAEQPSTGYKAVWPRDFYHCAMALAALGDRQTPLAAYRYLPRVQVGANTPNNRGAGGWFLQKSHVDGTPEWVAVQLDQTAAPIMLAWRLHDVGWLSDAELTASYRNVLKPAADFLVTGGDVNIDWNQNTVTPPATQQERWEEQGGHSPSTTAAVIAGLVIAGEIAEHARDMPSAQRYRAAADAYSAEVERRMFTTNGRFGDGRYYLRITRDDDPNNRSVLESRNGQIEPPEDEVVDAGFLELVRYGVRRADDPFILASLPELDEARDDMHRVRYDFAFPGEEGAVPGWRRYGVDGYGEDATTGANYGVGGQMAPGQRGRVWPFFTGERGHYELARASMLGRPGPGAVAQIRRVYVRGMEQFANEGLMLSEQVWDGVGAASPHNYGMGRGTNSATPLAWTHAEYITLLRSVSDGVVWDLYEPVRARYARTTPAG